MNKIWYFSQKRCSDIQKAHSLFIFILTVLWTVPPFFITLAGCVLLHIEPIEAFSWSLSLCGLTGIFIGFFGSMVYLIREG